MSIFVFINVMVWYAVVTVCLCVIALMLLRLIVSYANLNPFGWLALNVRRASDPLVNPIRRGLARTGLDPKLAPLGTILITILLGYIALPLSDTALMTLKGIILSMRAGNLGCLVGFLLSGLLALYSLMFFTCIIFSWWLSSVNPVMRFLLKITEPILVPLRRHIPPIGMFDISPMVVLIVLSLFQRAIDGTLQARCVY